MNKVSPLVGWQASQSAEAQPNGWRHGGLQSCLCPAPKNLHLPSWAACRWERAVEQVSMGWGRGMGQGPTPQSMRCVAMQRHAHPTKPKSLLCILKAPQQAGGQSAGHAEWEDTVPRFRSLRESLLSHQARLTLPRTTDCLCQQDPLDQVHIHQCTVCSATPNHLLNDQLHERSHKAGMLALNAGMVWSTLDNIQLLCFLWTQLYPDSASSHGSGGGWLHSVYPGGLLRCLPASAQLCRVPEVRAAPRSYSLPAAGRSVAGTWLTLQLHPPIMTAQKLLHPHLLPSQSTQ